MALVSCGNIAELGLVPPVIVFVTGLGDVDQGGMYAPGVVAFMSKPYYRVDLLNVLQNFVGQP
jgi:hypothetical protein